jgi:hypothetical protein
MLDYAKGSRPASGCLLKLLAAGRDPLQTPAFPESCRSRAGPDVGDAAPVDCNVEHATVSAKAVVCGRPPYRQIMHVSTTDLAPVQLLARKSRTCLSSDRESELPTSCATRA